ncbi:MAG: hypothetical protein R3360_05960, partial [Alphaproteobacteria bacterium]|nr:hypothetical protein [Alphaproteobacteria bacterium]
LALGGYFADEHSLTYGLFGDIDRLYSVEIGASYLITPSFRVLGRLQFLDYSTLLDGGLDGPAGSLYLGTQLGF